MFPQELQRTRTLLNLPGVAVTYALPRKIHGLKWARSLPPGQSCQPTLVTRFFPPELLPGCQRLPPLLGRLPRRPRPGCRRRHRQRCLRRAGARQGANLQSIPCLVSMSRCRLCEAGLLPSVCVHPQGLMAADPEVYFMDVRTDIVRRLC